MAVAENHVIGNKGEVPWRIARDMRHFRARTIGRPVIMGRRTWESLGGPLSERYNIVLSRRISRVSGADVAGNVDSARMLAEAWCRAHDCIEIMVIGGAEIYRLFEPFAEYIYLTRVHDRPQGDCVYALSTPEAWCERSRVRHVAASGESADYSFIELEQKGIKRDIKHA